MTRTPTVVESSIEIDASAHEVWRVLTELDRFSSWNPFIRQASGFTNVGQNVLLGVRTSLHIPLHFHARIRTHVPDRELRWFGYVLVPWLASGDHVFEVESLGDHRVRFTQRETFAGVLPRLARRLVEREAKRGFDAMNAALARRVQAKEPS